jgi:hypothetical protein
MEKERFEIQDSLIEFLTDNFKMDLVDTLYDKIMSVIDKTIEEDETNG